VIGHWIRIKACRGPLGGCAETHVMTTVPVTLRVGAVEWEIGELHHGAGAAALPHMLRMVACEMERADAD
jgi:hypothetical protein